MEYIAHIRKSDRGIQSVEEHLSGVQVLAESYGKKLGISHITGLAGLLHDMGKFTDAFQEYIMLAVNNPDFAPSKGSVDHSTAGGKLLFQLYHTQSPSLYKALVAEIAGNAIISHHSYLHDFLDPERQSPYLNRVDVKDLDEFETTKNLFFGRVMNESKLHSYVSKAASEAEAFLNLPGGGSQESKLMFLTKFVFSSLIDADRTNTRLFEENRTIEPEVDQLELFNAYYAKLMDKLADFQQEEQTPIRVLRREMSDQCERFAERPSGIYTLSVPTGGGKTLASLRYALMHAIRRGKKRIIYVVPYTTIIEQNAKEVRQLLKDDVHILEHHSNVVDDRDDNDELDDGFINTRQKLNLAKDNWDCPIIFTTMVQFLNVFYAKGSGNIRRMHNLCESVIIFDEVQKVPVRCVSLFNTALNFLKNYGHSSLILCTATQPALDYVRHRLEKSEVGEIVSNRESVVEAFHRVEIIDRATDEEFDNERLAGFVGEQLNEVRNVLVILNTKSVVKGLYRQLNTGEVPTYHLSTSMCAAHRKDVLEKIRGHLDREERIVCISTPLIEAGVDISFECVIRSLSGLDSIKQAAGRCNRHGKHALRRVYVIDQIEEKLNHLEEIQIGKTLTKRILIDLKKDQNHHGGSVQSDQALERYFKEFYKEFSTRLDYPVGQLRSNQVALLMADRNEIVHAYKQERGSIPKLCIVNSYRTAAEHFEVIGDNTNSVIVPYGDKGKEIIAGLNGNETIDDLSRLLRSAQQYSVNVFSWELKELSKQGGVVSLLDGKVLALKESAYSEKYGLELGSDTEMEVQFVGWS